MVEDRLPAAQVISPNDGGQEQHGRELDAQDIGAEKGQADRARRDGSSREAVPSSGGQDDQELRQQGGGKKGRSGPCSKARPGSAARPVGLQVEHHDDEDEEDDDGPSVDDHLEGRGERRAEREEHDGGRQERHDEIEEGVDGVPPGDGQPGGRDGRGRGAPEDHGHEGHGRRLLRSTGGSSVGSPSLPGTATPATL
jgi:hypothetical protein